MRLNSDDVLLIHVKVGWSGLKSFRENSNDLFYDGLKVTSQLDAHVYICEWSEFNIVAAWIGFSTLI